MRVHEQSLPRTAVDALGASPEVGQANAWEDAAHDHPVELFSIPSRLLVLEVLRRSLEFTQYTSYEYTERLKRAGIAPSRGRTGTALDNAMAESVISTLKRELISRYRWPTRLDLELALVTYIGWYNARRRHRSLKRTSNGQTRRQAPLQVLEQYNQQASGNLVPK